MTEKKWGRVRTQGIAADGGEVVKPTTPSEAFEDIAFDDLTLGIVRRTGYELAPTMVATFRSAVDAGLGEVPEAGTPVPPSVYCSFLPMFRALGGRMEQGTVHTHQRVTMHAEPARVGDVLDVEVMVACTETDGRRRRVEVVTVFSNRGRAFCTTHSRYLWGYTAPSGGAR
jgi:hypothetical protein